MVVRKLKPPETEAGMLEEAARLADDIVGAAEGHNYGMFLLACSIALGRQAARTSADITPAVAVLLDTMRKEYLEEKRLMLKKAQEGLR